jgi:hypothetical protein
LWGGIRKKPQEHSQEWLCYRITVEVVPRCGAAMLRPYEEKDKLRRLA